MVWTHFACPGETDVCLQTALFTSDLCVRLQSQTTVKMVRMVLSLEGHPDRLSRLLAIARLLLSEVDQSATENC